ncbi:hypothetical protein [Phyllobacterium endophyticum]|uniref:hypothetical protein n=1 Tax=Phyllobacterium endophyticum TaxID=1149773 RepID=UPI0016507793|nr:hypothetical protein [Phyllobacterium endophyticum]
MTKTLLIDGDALVYQLAFSAETKTNWADEGEEPIWTIQADEAETTFRLMRAVDALIETHWADAAIFALSDPTANFRLDILPTYKGNRKESVKPVLHERMREVVQEKFKTYLKPRLEADDTIGILATHPKIIPGEKIIISDDKDFNTIACPRAKFRKNKKTKELETFDPSHLEANFYHLQQTLSGDMTDFYAGCPGIGPIKAEKKLRAYQGEDPWVDVVLKEYALKGLTHEDALVQARCARILRHWDFDFLTQQPILWNP